MNWKKSAKQVVTLVRESNGFLDVYLTDGGFSYKDDGHSRPKLGDEVWITSGSFGKGTLRLKWTGRNLDIKPASYD